MTTRSNISLDCRISPRAAEHPDFALREGNRDVIGAELLGDGLVNFSLRWAVISYGRPRFDGDVDG